METTFGEMAVSLITVKPTNSLILYMEFLSMNKMICLTVNYSSETGVTILSETDRQCPSVQLLKAERLGDVTQLK
jgi:hypothetical protein